MGVNYYDARPINVLNDEELSAVIEDRLQRLSQFEDIVAKLADELEKARFEQQSRKEKK